MSHTRSLDQSLLGSGAAQTIFHLGRFANWLGHGEEALAFLDEVLDDAVILPTIEAAVADLSDWGTKQFESIFDLRLFRTVLFAALRLTEPREVVETGVLHGMTSLFLLRALELNGCGRLTSIDLPSYAASGPANKDGYDSVLPDGAQPGWLVPRDLYPEWDLQLGSTRDRLPLMDDIEGLGLFLHDSEHTTATMRFELEWAWPRLVGGGLLVCDNIEASTAFADFCVRVGRTPLYFPTPDLRFSPQPRFGMIRK